MVLLYNIQSTDSAFMDYCCCRWGAVSIGSVIAGIAAGLQPETTKLSELLPDEAREKPYLSKLELDNKWIATLAGVSLSHI